MKSEPYMSATITDEGRVKLEIHGPGNKLLVLLEEEAVSIFEELKNEGNPATMALFWLFFKNVAKEVFDIDL